MNTVDYLFYEDSSQYICVAPAMDALQGPTPLFKEILQPHEYLAVISKVPQPDGKC